MAAKNMHTTTVTIPKPPVICPIILSKKSTSLFAIPPLLIKFPANIKKGIANKGNESTPATAFCAIIVIGILEKQIKVINVAIPIAYPIGTLSISRIKNIKNNIATSIRFSPTLFS